MGFVIQAVVKYLRPTSILYFNMQTNMHVQQLIVS